MSIIKRICVFFVFSTLISTNVLAEESTHNWERTNPGGGGAISFVGATKNGTLVTASDLSGVYRSLDKGKSWIPLGANNGLLEGGINTLGFPNIDDTFLIGTYLGVYKTKDNGNTIYQAALETSYQAAPGKIKPDGLIESIGMSISEPAIGYLAHHEDWKPKLTFMKTTDAGDSWKIVPTVGMPPEARVIKIIVDRTNSSIVYVLTGKARYGCGPAQLYRSIDAGINWTRVAENLNGQAADILDVEVHPTDSNKFYVSTFKAGSCVDNDGNPKEYTNNENSDYENYIGDLNKNYASYNTYTTDDAGVTFTSLTKNKFDGYITGDDDKPLAVKRGITGIINVDYNNPDTIRVVNILHPYDWNDFSGTWESNDAGSTWTPQKHTPVTEWKKGYSEQYSSFVPSFHGLSKTVTKDKFNSNNMFGAFGQWAWGSFDGGHHLNNISTKDVNGEWRSTGVENLNGHALDINDKDPKVVYMGSIDAGFWASQNGGDSWKRSQPDAKKYPLYSWDLGELVNDPVMAKSGLGSNVYTVLSDPDDPKKVWASFGRDQYQENNESVFGLFKSTNSGNDWDLLKTGLPFGKHSVRIYGLSLDKNSPAGNRTLFVTVDGTVYKSINDGAKWKAVLPSSQSKGLKFTQVDQQDSNLVYAGGEGGLWVSKDGGDNWLQKGAAFKTEMQGNHQSMRNDIIPTDDDTDYDKNGNLVLNAHAWEGVFDIKTDPKNAGWVYVTAFGKGKGLYHSKDGGESWKKLLEDDVMRGVAIAPQDSDLIYATASSSYYSGGNGNSSGIQVSNDAGKTWKAVNQGMAWNYGGTIEISHGANPKVWAWSPGTGVQFSPVPLLADADNDGLPDAWEDDNGLDKNNPADALQDKDADGLSNLQEFQLGTNPNNKDTDGDGATDSDEIRLGTDPLDAQSIPPSIIPSLSDWALLLLSLLLGLFGFFNQNFLKRDF